MEEKTDWEEFIDMNALSIAEKNNGREACKMAIADVIEQIEDCKNFHEICSVIALIKLKHGLQ